MQTKNNLNKSNDCYGEIGVVSEYEDKGFVLLEKKIYSKYLTKPKARILDIGCFVGRVSFPLAQKGFEIFGIDTASIAIKRANELKKKKKVKNVHFKIASAANIPFKHGIFDYVLFPYNTIENIPSKKLRIAAMKEASRTLKKYGLVLFSAHNRFYPKYFLGITINEILKFLLKALIIFRLDKFLPLIRKEYIKEKINTEFGSVLWIEPGGKKFSRYHFSTLKEIKELLKLSSLRLAEKISVMDHSPQKINADILKIKYLSMIRAPIFYYVCRKE